MDDPWSIRSASAEDALAIAAAERLCFSDPWSEGAIRSTLQNATVVSLVAERDGRLAGYLLARMIAGEAEILNLAVLPGERRKGLGSMLLTAGLAGLERAGAQSVFLEVRESNEAAKRLYSVAGFRPVGVRPGYYRRPNESAYVLRRELGRFA
jgi:ribosomal-protein-alanine N-acetyltransferase